MNRSLIMAAAVAVAGAAGAYYLTTGGGTSSTAGLPFAAEAQQASDIDTSGIVEMVIGNEDAAVTVVEYASYTCPHCASFHENAFKQLKANYIDTGKIKFVYREVYFDRFGLWASMVARCGGEERFFGINDLLYTQQGTWARGEPGVIADNLRTIGKTAGLSEDQVNACLQDGDKAQTLVAWFQENAQADDISSTPSFVIDGTKYSNMSYSDFAELLDEKLGN
jgi:protein-disulfide isomerase